MRLVHLGIHSFLGIPEASFDFKKPINIFLGPNEAGKSSIASAPEFLITGYCRGIALKKDLMAVVHEGNKRAEIVATCPDVTIRRSRASSGESFRVIAGEKETAITPLPFSNLSRFALNPFSYFEMSADERKGVLFNLLFGGSKIPPERIQALLLTEGFKGEIVNVYSQIASEQGFPKAEQRAIDHRRDAKRDIEISERIAAPVSAYGEFDLAELDEEDVRQQLQAVEKEKSETQVNKRVIEVTESKESLETRLANVRADIEKTTRIALTETSPLEKRLQEIALQVKKLDLEKRQHEATINLQKDNLALASVPIDFEMCPVLAEKIRCPVNAKDRQKAKKLVDDAKRRATEITKEHEGQVLECLNTIEGLEEEGGRIEDQLEGIKEAEEDLERLKTTELALVTQIAEYPEKIETADNQIAELETRIQNGRQLLDMLVKFKNATAAYQAAQTKIAELRESVKTYDALAKALASDGVPAKLNQEALQVFQSRIHKTAATFNARCSLSTEDYLPVWNGRPYQLLSESQKWRARAVFQDAIANISKTPWLVMDGADVLDVNNRALMTDFLLSIAESYSTILVFATVGDEELRPSDHPLIDIWTVEKGKVRKLDSSNAAAA